MNSLSGGFVLAGPLQHDLPAPTPGGHQGERKDANEEREPAALRDFDDVGREKSEIDEQKKADDHDGERDTPAPNPARDDREQHGRD
jgi:hypothetical protein